MGNSEEKENITTMNVDRILKKLSDSGLDITQEEADKIGPDAVWERIVQAYSRDKQQIG